MGRWVLLSQSYEISRQTAHYFMQKVREAMKSSESHKMNDSVQVDEFTIGGKEEGKIKRIVERSPVFQSQLVCN